MDFYHSNIIIFIQKKILIILKLLIICTTLFAYKHIYSFRINQELSLKLFAVLLFTICILKIINNNELYFKKTNINLPIIIFILLLTISLLMSQNILISLNDYSVFIIYFFLYFLIINNVNDEVQFDSLIKLFFTISTIIAIYALLQYYGFDPYLKELSSITSTIGQKNWISNYLALVFPVIFSYFLLENIRKNKIIYYFLLSIFYTALIICQSRGIWISISLTLIFAIYIIIKFKLFEIFKRNKRWLIILFFTFLIITIIYSTDNPLNKSAITVPRRAISTFDEQDPSINTRLLMWKTTFNMIKDKPLLGSGIGTFKMNYLDYQAEFLKDNPYYIKYSGKAGEAHNEYLQMWAELGVIGLGIFLSIIFIFCNLVWEFLKEEKNSKKKLICWSLILGIICFLFHSLFTFPLHVPALGSTFFIIFGLIVVYIEDFNLSKIKKEINIKNILLKVVLNILILFLMIVAINCFVIKPYVAELYYFKGARYNVDKSYIKALPNFQYSIKLDPYNGRILHALGTAYFNLGMIDKAEDILQRAKKYITDVNTFYNLGLVYSQMNLLQKAEEEFKKSIYLNPKFDKAYYDLGYLYFIQEEYDKTIEQWNKIFEIKPNFPNKYIVLNNLGIAYKKKQMPDKALEYFLQALELAPEGSHIIEEIEKEIYNIYKSKLEN